MSETKTNLPYPEPPKNERVLIWIDYGGPKIAYIACWNGEVWESDHFGYSATTTEVVAWAEIPPMPDYAKPTETPTLVEPETYKGCTCPSACPKSCKGECGCEACRAAYADFLSGE